MKVLVACEYSGIVRDAFTALGHDAWSCDLLPTEKPGDHYEGDIKDVLFAEWDLIIAHPPCTYLCNSGVRWLHTQPGRVYKMQQACEFFNLFINSDCPFVCIENPVPHKYALLFIPKYTQIIQPWQFGHGEKKATCLWLKGLPKLQASNIVEGREQRIWKMPPGENRSKERSRTYEGIAQAMAEQWSETISLKKAI